MAANLTYFGTMTTLEISYEILEISRKIPHSENFLREFSQEKSKIFKGKPCMLVWDPGICQNLPEIPENFPGQVLEKGENFEKFRGNFREIS